MLARLGDNALLEWVLYRLKRANSIDSLVLAISDHERDDPLAQLADRLEVRLFRGSELDVLDRMVGAARDVGAASIVRVCADNPFVDPVEVDRLVRFFHEHSGDYVCNHQDRLGSNYADGFGAEIMSREVLEDVARRATAAEHREHVTLFMWEHPEAFDIRAVPAPGGLAHPTLRFDVDTPEDLERLQQLVRCGPLGIESSAGEVVAAALSNPI